ncbi:MAG: FdtA/QdtA family cupin domain-containing protein [Nitrospirae bacterium]|nr:FdtA/QdtA family cupin domain-containing protein [Magnetococcales bacterium]
MKGILGVADCLKHVPFEIRRIFYIHGVPEGMERSNHAHRKQEQFMIVMAGSVEAYVEYAGGSQRFTLDRPNLGLYIPALTWLRIRLSGLNAVCVVLTSDLYDEADYIRDRAEFDRLMVSAK